MNFEVKLSHFLFRRIGFDISNGISPDDRYVEIAKGFDYNDVVPVKGVINGYFIENQNLELSIDILNQ